MTWISIDVALPQIDGEYLCYTTYGGGQVDIFPFYRKRFSSYECQDYDPDPSDDITHWMPLPEKP